MPGCRRLLHVGLQRLLVKLTKCSTAQSHPHRRGAWKRVKDRTRPASVRGDFPTRAARLAQCGRLAGADLDAGKLEDGVVLDAEVS